MQRSDRRVVITGLGLISPLGIGLAPNWSALAEGRGALAKLRAFPVEGLPTDIGGEVQDFEAKRWVKALAASPKHEKHLRKNIKYMARDIQLAVAAAEMAVVDAGLSYRGTDPAHSPLEGVDPTRIGVDLGAGLISTELDELATAVDLSFAGAGGEFDYRTWGRDGIPLIEPIWLLKYLPNMLACHISILWDCQGPSNTITEAEAASNVAVGEACRIIARGRADVMVSGGADSKIHPLSVIRMSLLDQMSHWRGEPSRALRPFDRTRDGWVPGEGAGILVLEEHGHALARGARVYGEVLGFGSGCDATPGGGLDPEGVGTEIAIRAALRDAGLRPDEIGHVNAHGAGTVAMDLAESRALVRVFGQRSVPVTALKGYVGNIVSGCGAVELVGSLMGVNRGLIPPTLNCDEPDPALPLDLVRGAPRPSANPIFLTTNLTRHGQAAALVVRGNPGPA